MGRSQTAPYQTWIAPVLIVAGVVAAYSNSFHGPFVLDDLSSIVTNPTLRHPWPPAGILSPPEHEGLTVEARPVLNVSLALNYALGGLHVEGYHLANLGIHAASSLLVLWLLGRLVRDRWAAAAGALLWALHPLCTAAVTYVVQRAESLMAFFYLATLCAFLKAAGTAPSSPTKPNFSAGWAALSVVACALGMGTKEVMVSAPLIVLALDSTLVSSGVRHALRRRRFYYVALAGTWAIVGALTVSSAGRGGTSGLGIEVSAIDYWLTQPGAVLHYLRLAVWPSRLVFDYGAPWLRDAREALVPSLAILSLACVGVIALVRCSPIGVALLWFFAVLAPTSIVPGARQVLAEHRMYLALVPLVWILAAALPGLPCRSLPLLRVGLLGAALALGYATYERNRDYRSAVALYASDVVAMPTNPFALSNEATALLDDHRYDEARAFAERAVKVSPSFAAAWDDLGSALLHEGRASEAERAFAAAVRSDPRFWGARSNWAQALAAKGDLRGAIVQAQLAVAGSPRDPAIESELGTLLGLTGRYAEAEVALRNAISMDPDSAQAWMNLGVVHDAMGDHAGSVAELLTAVRLEPSNAQSYFNLGHAYHGLGEWTKAMDAYREALHRDPGYSSAHENLGNLLLATGDSQGAVASYRDALALEPARPDYHYNLGNALLALGRNSDAADEFLLALRLNPGLEPARVALERLRGIR